MPRFFKYQAEILRSNPGSTYAICLNPDYNFQVFQRIYVCFDACKRGFLAGCRNVIGIDGCFFKGTCNGELICTIGRDANDQIYPVAWAVVEKETENSWTWFLGLLQKDLQIPIGGNGWVIISDQQKVTNLIFICQLIDIVNSYLIIFNCCACQGLLNSVAELFPNIEHRMCTRNIYAN